MRKLLMFLFLAPFVSSGQMGPIPENAYGKYEFVHKIPINETKQEIFKRLHEWLAIRKFGEPISINTQNNKTFTGKLAANNFDYVDTSEGRIRGTGYVQYSPGRPYMYVTFDFQLIAEDGYYTYDFKRFSVIKFVKGKSMRAHSLRVSIYSGGGGNMSDAQSDTKPLEDVVDEAGRIRSKLIRNQSLKDIELFKQNMKDMLLQLNRTVKGEF